MSKEVFKNIEGYDNYLVSSYGRVLNVKKPKYLKQSLSPGGRYKFVSICNKCGCKQYYVHRLVATAFIPNPHNKPCVDHIDTDTFNNDADNLRWTTTKENHNNPISIEKHTAANRSRERNDTTPRKVGQYTLDGELVEVYDSLRKASKAMGKTNNVTMIMNCCKGKANTAYGFKWRYLP